MEKPQHDKYGFTADYEKQQKDHQDKLRAEANNVFDIQNGWMEVLRLCEIPDRTRFDCSVCRKPECINAYNKVRTLWPELSEWPSDPSVNEIENLARMPGKEKTS